ncbi:MAG: M55 family metallopeptidase [Atribacterota bacterium]
MKIYISADIEGITGIANWDEANKTKPDYQKYSKQMTEEVKAACEGAINAGAKAIFIKDAHGSGRNIIADDLPQNIKLIRGWSGHPFAMVQELDESFDALIFIGYHSCSSSSDNPLSHTMSSTSYNYIKLNEKLASEFLIYCYAAATVGVPLVFLSGDEGLCNQVNSVNENIRTVAVNKGRGNSVISIHPQLAIKKIKKGVELALREDINKCKINLPRHFKMELSFKNHAQAYKISFYPKVEQISPTNVIFESDNYFEVLKMFSFSRST